jgi:hypothetical protein
VTERFAIRSDDIGFEPVDDELLVIDFVTSDYYVLNATAAAAWRALANSPRSADELAHAFSGSDDDARAAMRRDLEAFLTALAADGLVVATDAGGDAGKAPELATPYVVPRFEKFGTLERLMIAGE